MLVVDLVPPRAHLPVSYWGLMEGTHEGLVSRLPFDLLQSSLAALGTAAVPEKLLLLAVVFLAGLGMHRLVPVSSRAARAYAGVLYAVNPFVYDRLWVGQWFLLLGYALLPFTFSAFLALRRGVPYAAWRFGILAALVGAASAHMFVLLCLLCLVTAALGVRRGGRAAGRTALGFGLGGLLSLYWLVPTPGIRDFWGHVGREQLAYYRTEGLGGLGVEGAVAGLQGFWNDAEPVGAFVRPWPLLAGAVICVAVVGLVAGRRRAPSVAVAVVGVLAFLFALGDASPLTRWAFVPLLEHLPPLRSFREPQKAAALLAFAYAYLGALGVEDLLRAARRPRVARTAAALLLALPLALGYRELGGLWGTLRTSTFPASWSQAASVLERDARASQTLFLPWHGYLELGFAGDRLAANPAVPFFPTPVLASSAVGGEPGLEDVSDPVERRVSELLAAGRRGSDVAPCLARLGVRDILVAKVVGWEVYRFLDFAPGVVVVRRWDDLVLYRLQRPGGLVMAATGTGRCGPVRPLAAHVRDPAHISIDAPVPAGATLLVGMRQPDRWAMRGGEAVFTPWPSYRRNYLLGAGGFFAFVLSLARAARRRSPRNGRPG